MSHYPLEKNISGVVFIGNKGSKLLATENNFVYNSGSNRLGINTGNPLYTLDVNGTGNFLAIRFPDGTIQTSAGAGSGFNYYDFNLAVGNESSTVISSGETVSFSGFGNTRVSRSGNFIIVSGLDTNTTYSAGTGLNLVGTTFNVSGSTTSNSGIVQLQDSIQDNVTNRAVTPNAVFDYVGSVSGAINTRLLSTGSDLLGRINTLSGNLITTGSNLQAQINSVSGNLYNYWILNITGSNDQITRQQTVNFTGGGATSVSYNSSTNTVTISSTDNNTTYSAGTGLNLVGSTFNVSGSTTSNSGIVQLQDSVQDNIVNRAVTPNAVFDYVASVSGAINTRINTTGSDLLSRINTLSGNLISTGSNLQSQISSNDVDISNLSGLISSVSGSITSGTPYGLAYFDSGSALRSSTSSSNIQFKILANSGIAFEGSEGQLFSIVNNLTSGVIFSVNDVIGLPLIEADANGYVNLVRYGENVSIGSYAESGSRLTLTPGIASRRGFVISGAAGQTADLFEVINASGNMLFAIMPDGSTAVGTGFASARLDVIDTGSNIIPTLRLMNLNANFDPYIRFTPSATGNSFAVGIDDSDSDKFKLSFGTDLGTNDRLIIATGGQIGINNTSPTDTLNVNTLSSSTKGLVVRGSAAQSANLSEWQNSSSTILASINNGGTIYTTGNIGIGVTNPANRLHIRSNSGTLVRLGLNEANANGLEAGIEWYSNEAITADYFGGLKLKFQDGSASSNRQIQFFVSDSNTPKMVIAGNGNIGIGTLSPSSNLHILGSSDQRIIIQATGNAILNFAGLNNQNPFSITHDGTDFTVLEGSRTRVRIRNAGDLSLFTRNIGGTAIERFTIKDITGFIGINNSSANFTLDVNGTGNFSSGVRYPDGLTQIIAYTGLNGIATSGYVDQISGALNTRLISTGNDLLSRINTLSGNLISTGGNLQSQINSVSGLLYNYWTLIAPGAAADNITRQQSVTFTGIGSTSVSYNTSTNVLTISGTDLNTTYVAGTGLNLVGTTFNVSGATTSTSGIVQLQDSVQDNITNRAITPNAVFDYVGIVSGDISSRLVSTGNTLQSQINSASGDLSNRLNSTGNTLTSQINSVSGLLYNYWTLIAPGASADNITRQQSVTFTGTGATSVSYNASTNVLTINSTDNNTTYSAGTGLNLVGTTFNVSGSTTSNSGIVQLQDTIQDNITNRAVTPNAVFDYVASVSGDISTRINTTGSDLLSRINIVSGNLITTGSNLQSQINSVSGLLYNYWTINVTGLTDQITKEQTVIFTGTGATSIAYNSSTNTVTISSTDNNTTYSAGTGLNLIGTTFNASGATTSTSGIVQLQDSIQDNITNRAVTPNAVFDYVASVSGAINTRIISTGNNLQSQITANDADIATLSGLINNVSGTTLGAASGVAFFSNAGTLTGNSNFTYDSGNSILNINGSLTAISKSFLIEHPSKPGKKLQYASLESPYHGIRLTGRDKLINNVCIVKLPDYIYNLVREEDVNIQITNIRHSQIIYVEAIDVLNNRFTVACDGLNYHNEYEFFWTFTAVRKDIDRLEVEV